MENHICTCTLEGRTTCRLMYLHLEGSLNLYQYMICWSTAAVEKCLCLRQRLEKVTGGIAERKDLRWHKSVTRNILAASSGGVLCVKTPVGCLNFTDSEQKRLLFSLRDQLQISTPERKWNNTSFFCQKQWVAHAFLSNLNLIFGEFSFITRTKENRHSRQMIFVFEI